jgi:hypothetical protein
MHPYEAMYFNQLAGGVQKASELFDFDYWGFSTQEMVRYLESHEQDSSKKVFVEWIGFRGSYFPGNTFVLTGGPGSQADYVIIPNSKNYFDGAIAYWKKNGTLIYTPMRQGAIIGYLFRTKKL